MFKKLYRCYLISKTGPHNHLNKGDRILMPASALTQLSTMTVDYPLLFKLTNLQTEKISHCGVMEFTADEGTVLLPVGVMRNADLQEGDLVELCNVSLKKATFMKLQPHKTAFLEEVSDPKAVLEQTLTQFSCLTIGDNIEIDHLDEKFSMIVLDTKPDKAVSIIETDCEVDFAPALDYKEPEKKIVKKRALESHEVNEEKRVEKFKPFTGIGRRLDGGLSTNNNVDSESDSFGSERAPKVRKLVFGDSVQQGMNNSRECCCEALKDKVVGKEEDKGFKPFTGKSYRLM